MSTDTEKAAHFAQEFVMRENNIMQNSMTGRVRRLRDIILRGEEQTQNYRLKVLASIILYISDLI